MSLPDYAKPTAGMIIRSIIPATQSVYDIPASYFGVYRVAAMNDTSPVSSGGTLLLLPSLVDNNGIPDDRGGLLFDQDGTVYSLSNKNSKWMTLVNTTRTINGHDLSKNVVVNAADIFGTAKYLGNTDLDTLTTPDLYYQDANANATTTRHYPTSLAGSLQIYKDAGVTQIYTAYNGGGQWRRGYYNNVWSAWVTAYDSNNLNPVLSVNNIFPDEKGNVNVSPKFNGDGAYAFISARFDTIAVPGYGNAYAPFRCGQILTGSQLNPASYVIQPDAIGSSSSYWSGGGDTLCGVWRACSDATTTGYDTSRTAIAYFMASRVPVGTIDAFSNIKSPDNWDGGSAYVNLTCDIDGVGTGLLFTASPDDPEEYGRQLFANAQAGMYS
ncbi:hypothetical protein YT28_03200 [Salmonella enterica subsp. salamae]|nr:hypothetical protein [Salmonella enterica subsp. salamae]EDW4470765.1 hypothetical protein [Salmonella enterica subsp. salamae]